MKKIYIAAVLALSLAACNNKETLNPESVIQPRVTAQTALDTYIYNNFQKPYNISVTYNYIDADFEMGKYFYPPTEAKVQPMLEIVKKVWIDSYTQVAGQDFIKSVAPRQISLIGGYNMNSDGTITLGFADSGMKITLFNVDQLDVTKHTATRQYFHTIQHEYCHIINQRKPYSEEYGKITPSDYTANWYNIQLADANKKGFITPYSMLNDIEDFAEMTSGILSMSKTDWDAKVNAIPEEGRNIIRKKEEFVVSYFKSEWNIDLYKLQEVVENQMLSVLQ
nr:putative zinc-binding metallopeptidase [uncultured Capnocytophaga sp.]